MVDIWGFKDWFDDFLSPNFRRCGLSFKVPVWFLTRGWHLVLWNVCLGQWKPWTWLWWPNEFQSCWRLCEEIWGWMVGFWLVDGWLMMVGVGWWWFILVNHVWWCLRLVVFLLFLGDLKALNSAQLLYLLNQTTLLDVTWYASWYRNKSSLKDHHFLLSRLSQSLFFPGNACVLGCYSP